MLAETGASVFVSDAGQIDRNTTDLFDAHGINWESGVHTASALNCEAMVLSPGVPTEAAIVQEAISIQRSVLSEIEVAFRHCAADIVAITGSNGKTTTTTLTGHILEYATRDTSRHVFVAGNIGAAFSDIALTAGPQDVVVLEVSSFQLDHIRLFRPRVSVILNITPDHLDRYGGDFHAYASSKLRVYENQRTDDVLVVNGDDELLRDITTTTDGPRRLTISLREEVAEGGFLAGDEMIIRVNNKEMRMPTEDLPLRGRHNLYNSLAAAVAARAMEVRSDVIRESIASFQGVPHRLEFVRELDGVRYYNDSKATNVNAVWYALESFTEPIVLIAGGRDKGNDYSSLRQLVRRRVRTLIALGESAEEIEAELGPEASRAVRVDSMDAAVQTARIVAEEGDVVLLSPACASFDMFENYEHRGDTFKKLVGSL